MKYRVRSVADVRRLAVCACCAELGMHGVDLLLTSFDEDARGRKRNKKYAHARCLLTSELLALPADELGNVRIGDVVPEVIDQIVHILKEKS